MVRILILSAFFCLAQAAFAAESGTVFQDGSAFILARSVKLGADGSDKKLPNGKVPYKFEKKEKYECVKDADCAGVFICRSNKCIDPCTGVTCPGGQKCSIGKCVSCSRGESCGCTGTTVSSGSGSCFDPCDPNKCASSTPTCTRSGANYSCACTSTSCGAGKKCSGSSCTNCSANESCNCPSGQKANGSGGCATVACSGNSDCGAGKQCANAGTTSAYCYNCSANTQCTCPSGQLANGSGGCVKPVCYDNTPCGAGRQCIDPGKYNAKCDPCPSGTQCTCPSGQVADGSGGCGVAGCAGALAAARPDVAVAKDVSSLATALFSDKSIIAVTENITTTNQIALGGKTLVGPKYFSSVSGCSTAATPTLKIQKNDADGIQLKEGEEINNLNLAFETTSTSASAISGGGTLTDVKITAAPAKAGYLQAAVKVSGSLALKGNVEINTNLLALDTLSGSRTNVIGALNVTGENSSGDGMRIAGTFEIMSSGSLTVSGKRYNAVNINKGTFTVNGGLNLKGGGGKGFDMSGGTLNINKDGAYIKAGYNGIRTWSAAAININGSTTFDFEPFTDNSQKTAISLNQWEDKLTVNKPITGQGDIGSTSRLDTILYLCGGIEEEGGYIRVNSTLKKGTSKGPVGIYQCGRGNLRLQSGAHVIVDQYHGYQQSAKISAVSGAKLSVKGICRKATSSQTFTFPKGDGSSYGWQVPLSSPPSIFSSGC